MSTFPYLPLTLLTCSTNIWPLRGGSTQEPPLSGRIRKVVASHAAVARSNPAECTDLYYAQGAQGVLPMRVGGATSQLDLPSLTPLSVAGCG